MEVIKIYPKGFGANTYLVTADGKNAVVIDPAGEMIVNECICRELDPAYVLLTHCHFDHVMGAAALQARGAKVICLDKEKKNIGTGVDLFDYFGAPRKPFTVDETISDGETRTLAGISFLALSTPGHTDGSACYLVEQERILFTGDTLFEGSIGRTDFPTGSVSELRRSLKKLRDLDGEYTVYAGHNEDTTLEIERKTNPYLLSVE